MVESLYQKHFKNLFFDEIKKFPGLVGADLAKVVTTTSSYKFGNHSSEKFNLAVFDYGVKIKYT